MISQRQSKKKAADRGFGRGQANWGLCNKWGVGVEKNGYEAVKWSKKAAEQGDATGQNNLGTCYADGEGGLEKDEYEAVKWYRKAAEQGHENARKILSESYGINTKEE